MPKKAGIVFVAFGAVLILSALLLFLHNGQEDANAGEQAQVVLQELQSVIRQTAPQSGQTAPTKPAPDRMTEPPETQPREMTVVELDGYGYIGYLSIPALELELPVMSEWDYDRLKTAPCRHFGSVYTDDLVIAGHNYKTHFAYLRSLEPGDEVIFTDMDGQVHTYHVAAVTTVDPTDVDSVQFSGYPLVLYTCTYTAEARITVFCTRA